MALGFTFIMRRQSVVVANFYRDLEKARKAEDLVRDVFASMTDDYTFTTVGDQREYFHKGDILAVDANGNKHFIEVKDDSCIGRTQNVLCEEEVFYNSIGDYLPGNMYSDYEIYCVVSQDTRKIYVIDFKVLKRIYHKGRYTDMPHKDQTSFVYLVPVAMIKRENGLIAVIDY